jgi:Mce-associated membrane protein
MPDRSRNRPRIAGQRRSPGTASTVEDTPVVEEKLTTTAPEAQEAPEQDVTPDTPGVVEDPLEEVAEEPATTDSDVPRGLGRALTIVLGIAVVLVLTVAVVLGIKAWQGQQAEDARDQAAAAGRKAAETALSYDYRDLDKSFAAARATMTPDFAGRFDETAKVAGELATKTKATVKADVREVGVRDGDADRVTLIIFVNQTTTSTITQGSPRVDLNRTRFTMVRKDGRWLVQEIAGL